MPFYMHEEEKFLRVWAELEKMQNYEQKTKKIR